jgi:hypothetical protein
VLTIFGGFQLFVEPLILWGTGGGPAQAGMSVVLHLYRTAFTSFDLGYASAIGVVLALIIMSVSLVTLKLFGFFKRHQNTLSDLQSVGNRFESRCMIFPVVVAKVVVLGARCQDKRVECNGSAVPQCYVLLTTVNGYNFTEYGFYIFFASKQCPDGNCNIAGRKGRRGNLVKQRLKQMMILPVDDRELGVGGGKMAAKLQTAEPGA